MTGLEYFEMLRLRNEAMKDPTVLGVYQTTKRRSGTTLAFCHTVLPDILSGNTVVIVDKDGPYYTNRVINIFLHMWNLAVVATPIYTREPRHNQKLVFNNFDEPVGLQIIPQRMVISGYSLRLFNIDTDWHPNESF